MQPKLESSRLTAHARQKINKGHEDEPVIERIVHGDTAACAAVVGRWQGPSRHRLCRDRGRAEDMAQEAFLRAFRGLGSWHRDTAFSTWLFALATNVYREEMRRFVPESVPIDENLPAAGSAEDATNEADRRRIVQTTLQSLPSKYRDPLVIY